MQLMRRLSAATVLTALMFGIGAALSVAAQLGLAQVMSPVAYGEFALFYSAGMILSGFGALGYDMAALRFMASRAPHGVSTEQRAFLGQASRHVTWGASVLAVGAAIVCVTTRVLPLSLALALIALVPSWAALRFLVSLLRTEDRAAGSLALDRVARDGSLFSLAAVVLLTGGQLELMVPVILLVSVTIFAAGICLVMMRTIFRRGARAGSKDERSLWSRAARRLLAINGIELLAGRFDLFVLALIGGKSLVGEMNLLIVLSTVAALPSVFIGFILMPRLAAANVEHRHEDIAREVALSTWLNVVSASVIAIGFIVGIWLFGEASFLAPLSGIPLAAVGWMFAARVTTSTVMARVAHLQMIGRERVVIVAHLTAIAAKGLAYVSLMQGIGLTSAALISLGSAAIFTLIVSLVGRKSGGF